MSTNRKTYKQENDRQRETSESQRDILRKSYEKQMKDKDVQYREYVDSSLSNQNSAMKKKTKELQKAHQTELASIAIAHNREVSAQDRKINELRKTSSTTIDALKRDKKFQTDKMSANFQSTLEGDRKFNEAVRDVQKDQHDEGIQRVKDKYQKAIADYVEGAEASRADFKDDVTRRSNNKVTSLQQELRDLKADYESKMLKNKNQKRIELQHLRDQMRDSNSKLQEVGELNSHALKDWHNRDIAVVNKKNDKILNQLNRRYRGEVHNLRMKQEENIEEQVWSRDLKIQQIKGKYEERIDLLRANNLRSEKNLKNYYERAIDEIKETNHDEQKALREKLNDERVSIVNSYKERFKDIDKTNREKLAAMQMGYENKIADLKDAQLTRLRTIEKHNRKDTKNVNKSHLKNLESSRVQAEVRLSQLKEQHGEAMEGLEKRHRREMEQLVRQQTKV